MLPHEAQRVRYIARSFNGHPPLGVNATLAAREKIEAIGDCFNGHPPLGVNATSLIAIANEIIEDSFNGHPPLGVNATVVRASQAREASARVSMGTHPWG